MNIEDQPASVNNDSVDKTTAEDAPRPVDIDNELPGYIPDTVRGKMLKDIERVREKIGLRLGGSAVGDRIAEQKPEDLARKIAALRSRRRNR